MAVWPSGFVSVVIRWFDGVAYPNCVTAPSGSVTRVRLPLGSTAMVVTRPAGSVTVWRWPDASYASVVTDE